MQLNTIPRSPSCQSEFLPLTCPQNNMALPSAALAVDGRASESEKGEYPISFPSQVAGFGIDTIYINYHISFDAKESIFSALAELKAWLQSGTDQEAHFKFGRTNLFSFNLQRTGTKIFSYILKSGDITLYLSPRSHTGSIPNAALHVGSISSQQGLTDTVKAFKNWVNHHLGVIFQESISRIDICADIKQDIAGTGIEQCERHICQSRHAGGFYSDRKLTGVQVGKQNVVLRVYDKVLEMQQKKAHEKQCFFNKLWNGYDGPITRVEYQLRREVIKDMFPENSSYRVVSEKIEEMWEYLTHKWFRQSEGEVDRVNKHQSRCEVSSFWAIVQDASKKKVEPMQRNRKQLHINIPALKKMVRGCMVTIAAGMGHAVDDFFGIMSTCRDLIEQEVAEHMQTVEYLRKFAVKQSAAYVTF